MSAAHTPYPKDGISRGARAVQRADRMVEHERAKVRALQKRNADLLAALLRIAEASDRSTRHPVSDHVTYFAHLAAIARTALAKVQS